MIQENENKANFIKNSIRLYHKEKTSWRIVQDLTDHNERVDSYKAKMMNERSIVRVHGLRRQNEQHVEEICKHYNSNF